MLGSFVVEFAGARGAGKSTLIRRLAQRLGAHDPNAWPPPPRRSAPVSQKLQAFVGAVPGLLTVPTLQVRWRPTATRDGIHPIVRRYVRVHLAYHRAQREPWGHLMDEGLCQIMQRLRLSANVPGMDQLWRDLVRHTPTPDAVVLVDTAHDVIAARRQARGGPGDLRYPRMDEDSRAVFDELRSWLLGAASGSNPLVRAILIEDDGLRGVDALADEIMEAVADGPYRKPVTEWP